MRIAQLTQRQLASALQGWRSAAAHVSRRRSCVRVCLVRMLHRLSTMAFARWMEMVSQQVCVRGVGLKVVRRLKHARLASALRGWSAQQVTQPRQKMGARGAQFLCSKILWRPSKRVSDPRPVFRIRCWPQVRSAALRAVARKMVLRLLHWQLGAALSAWWTWTQRQRQLKHVSRRIAGRWRWLQLAGAFTGWWAECEQMQEEALVSRCGGYLLAVIKRDREWGLCQRCVEGWQAWMRCVRRTLEPAVPLPLVGCGVCAADQPLLPPPRPGCPSRWCQDPARAAQGDGQARAAVAAHASAVDSGDSPGALGHVHGSCSRRVRSMWFNPARVSASREYLPPPLHTTHGESARRFAGRQQLLRAQFQLSLSAYRGPAAASTLSEPMGFTTVREAFSEHSPGMRRAAVTEQMPARGADEEGLRNEQEEEELTSGPSPGEDREGGLSLQEILLFEGVLSVCTVRPVSSYRERHSSNTDVGVGVGLENPQQTASPGVWIS